MLLLHRERNEVYLMHGCAECVAALIARDGFEDKLAGSESGSIYGYGTYFAENACKADQYATRNVAGEYHIILARVALGGHPYECNDVNASVPWPLKRGVVSWRAVNQLRLLHEVDAGTGLRFSSLKGTAYTRREFVVFRGIQAYPEFLVKYRRVGGSQQTA